MYSQNSSTLIGGRAGGMGYASANSSDEWSLFNNIGGLGKITSPYAGFACEVRPALIGANRIAAVIASPTKVGTIGLGVFKFGDDLYSEHVVSFGFGNTIGNTSLGTRMNYIQYKAEGFGTNTAFSLDFGGITQITPQVSVAAYIVNLTQSKLSVNSSRLPAKLVAGAGFKPTDKIFLASEIEKDLDYQIVWRSGMEYSVYKKGSKQVFFRTGCAINPNAFYFGLGVQKNDLKIDYALCTGQLIGAAHQASAVYSFSRKKIK